MGSSPIITAKSRDSVMVNTLKKAVQNYPSECKSRIGGSNPSPGSNGVFGLLVRNMVVTHVKSTVRNRNIPQIPLVV